jgi:hypothetical protein
MYYLLAINIFFFVEFVLEDSQERPTYVGCLPHTFITLYLQNNSWYIPVCMVTYRTAGNVDNFILSSTYIYETFFRLQYMRWQLI